ncbi:hypothetical protein MVEN_00610100 [Mycena venus]|uniref:Uncharacterized protein n=1 Tax=Mycena venus TaxID=2733690 RepID=A0A8H6YJZ4_9AGAR|nr:hypothetical protein MVEN_00610100 [Mycena venus]
MRRQPLRDRCNVPTPVRTGRKRANASSHACSYVAPSLNDRCRGDLPTSLIEEVPRTPHDPHGPRQFVPYLYLFSPPLAGAPPPPGNWTHTLRLLPPSKSRPKGSNDLVISGTGDPRGLNLHLPTAAFKKTHTHALHIATRQLLLARDFLALALPYYASAHPPETPLHSLGGCGAGSPASSPWSDTDSDCTPITHTPLEGLAGMMPRVPPRSQADPVRVLVLGPPRLVLAIALLYLVYASGCSIAQVMRGVLEGDGDTEWCRLIAEDGRMGLSEEDMELLERVAMKDM